MNFIKIIVDKINAAKEKGSIAAVLGVAAILAVVTLGIAAYSVQQIGQSKYVEGKTNINSAMNDVFTSISTDIYRTGTTPVQPNDFYNYDLLDVRVVVNDVKPIQANGSTAISGYQVSLTAVWKDSIVPATTSQKLIPISRAGTSTTITGFDSNGYAIWGP